MSAPFVAAQASLPRSLGPLLNLDQVGMLISGTAKPIASSSNDGMLGEGMQDILSSLEALASNSQLDPQKNLFADCTGG